MADRQPHARQCAVAFQRVRMRQLDDLRCRRELTAAEQAEADMLSHRLYMREWRAANRERFAADDARRRP